MSQLVLRNRSNEHTSLFAAFNNVPARFGQFVDATTEFIVSFGRFLVEIIRSTSIFLRRGIGSERGAILLTGIGIGYSFSAVRLWLLSRSVRAWCLTLLVEDEEEEPLVA